MMKCMPFWKGCNRNVDYVDRSRRGLDHVPDDIQRYSRSLEELLLDGNSIADLPKSFYQLVQLRKLTISENQIASLLPEVGNFTQLQEFDISHNELSIIPENIKLCKSLQILNFSSNPLQRLPGCLTQLKNLVELALNDTSISELPFDIGILSNLETLELRDNFIRTLPSSLSSLVNLRFLDLGGNMLDEIPGFIGRLRSLEELRFDCNDLGELPAEIGQLKKLAQLDVSENHVEFVPPEIGGLVSLTDLHLTCNQLECLPDTIGNMRKLCTLKIDQNRLLQVPATIGQCGCLQELILTENLLQELPPTIGRLKSLVILNVDKNRLMTIPAEMGNCTHLGVLSLRDNFLWRLPSELGNLKQLHVLDVSGNRLQHLPVSLGSCDLKAVWLSEKQAQPLLKFQQDIDQETGEKVLTCFLLPQQAYTEVAENLLKDSFVVMSDSENVPSWVGDPVRSTAVKFAEDTLTMTSDSESEMPFIRHNTPHPKNLRHRVTKPLVKDSDVKAIVAPEKTVDDSIDELPALPDLVRQNGVGVVPPPAVEQKTTSPVHQVAALDGSFRDDDNTESSTVYDTAQEQLSSDDTLTGDDLSSEENRTFDAVGGSEFSGISKASDVNANRVLSSVIRIVRRPGTAIGMSIAGGRGSVPFIGSDEGIFVSRVTPEGAAERAGLCVGDKVISVNSKSLVGVTHHDAVITVKSVTGDITLVVIKMDAAAAGSHSKWCDARETLDQSLNETIDDIIDPGTHSSVDSIPDGSNSSSHRGNTETASSKSRSSTLESESDSSDASVPASTVTQSEDSSQKAISTPASNPSTPTITPSLKIVAIAGSPRSLRRKPANAATAAADAPALTTPSTPTIPVSTNRSNSVKDALQSSLESSSTSSLQKQSPEAIATVRPDPDLRETPAPPSIPTSKNPPSSTNSPSTVRPKQIVKLTTVVLTSKKPASSQNKSNTIGQASENLASPRNQPKSIALSSENPSSPRTSHKNSHVNRSADSPHCLQLQTNVETVQTFPRAGRSNAVNSLPSKDTRSPQNLTQPSNVAGSSPQNGLNLPRNSTRSSPALSKSSPLIQRTLDVERSPKQSAASSLKVCRAAETELDASSINRVNVLSAASSLSYPIEKLVIIKTGGSIGMSIVGGLGQTSHPFGMEEPGIFISKIVPGGPASATSLRIGDRLMSVNGTDMRKATHNDAVAALVTPKDKLTVEVRRDPQPAGLQEINLELPAGESLGLCIQGGAGSQCGNIYDPTDEGIFISDILPGSAAARRESLKIGQRLLEVNGRSLLGTRHQDAVTALQQLHGTSVLLLVCDGINTARYSLPRSTSSSSKKNSKTTSGSKTSSAGSCVIAAPTNGSPAPSSKNSSPAPSNKNSSPAPSSKNCSPAPSNKNSSPAPSNKLPAAVESRSDAKNPAQSRLSLPAEAEPSQSLDGIDADDAAEEQVKDQERRQKAEQRRVARMRFLESASNRATEATNARPVALVVPTVADDKEQIELLTS